MTDMFIQFAPFVIFTALLVATEIVARTDFSLSDMEFDVFGFRSRSGSGLKF